MRGIALVLVLWLTVLLTVIASGFAYSMRSEGLATRNALSLAQARVLADGATQRTAFELMQSRTLPDAWAPDGQIHAWEQAGAQIAVYALDESGKIDLNTASDPLLLGLLQTAGGLDPTAAAQMLDVIGDWKDADDLRRPNGAELPDYQAAGLTYGPSNAPFEAIADLQRVLYMTPALYARLADSLTVFTRQTGINPLYATRTVLMALPNATAEVVDPYLQQRQDALAAKQPPPAFPLAVDGGQPVNVWRIRAGVTMPDGVVFIREAVLRPAIDGKSPPTVLLWQDG
jgi:general secretion pathway protein K